MHWILSTIICYDVKIFIYLFTRKSGFSAVDPSTIKKGKHSIDGNINYIHVMLNTFYRKTFYTVEKILLKLLLKTFGVKLNFVPP